jgi:hypothetical protein
MAYLTLPGLQYKDYSDDPLADNVECKLHAGLIKSLGANSLRVYSVDMANSHQDCMTTFADAGVYVWVALSNGHTQLLQKNDVSYILRSFRDMLLIPDIH